MMKALMESTETANEVSSQSNSSCENEAFYDNEIAPKLAELAQACSARGMNFAAAVQYAPDAYASVSLVDTERACTGMFMTRQAIMSNGNLDSLVLGTLKWLRAKGINTGASLVARILERAGDDRKTLAPAYHNERKSHAG